MFKKVGHSLLTPIYLKLFSKKYTHTHSKCRTMLIMNLGSRYIDVQCIILSISLCLKLFIIQSWMRGEEMLLRPKTFEKKVNMSIRKLKRVNKESYVLFSM